MLKITSEGSEVETQAVTMASKERLIPRMTWSTSTPSNRKPSYFQWLSFWGGLQKDEMKPQGQKQAMETVEKQKLRFPTVPTALLLTNQDEKTNDQK